MAKELAIMGIRGMNFFVVRFGAYRIGKCSITFETHSRTIVQVAQPKFKTYEIDLLDFIMVTDLLDRTIWTGPFRSTSWTGPIGPDRLDRTVWTGPYGPVRTIFKMDLEQCFIGGACIGS